MECPLGVFIGMSLCKLEGKDKSLACKICVKKHWLRN